MAEPIYGHELLSILSHSPEGCTRHELRQKADAVFGASAIYTNCSGTAFDFDGVVSFLASRGKLALDGENVLLGPVPGCGTGHHEH